MSLTELAQSQTLQTNDDKALRSRTHRTILCSNALLHDRGNAADDETQNLTRSENIKQKQISGEELG